MKTYVIELWDADNDHPYLITDAQGKVRKFRYYDTALEVATDFMRNETDKDRWHGYFITTMPSRFAKPLL